MATSAFGKAFRAARESGSGEFEFNGKKYNTKLKEETKSASKAEPKAEPKAETKPKSEPVRSLSDDRPLSGASLSDVVSTPSAKNVGGDAAKASQEKRDTAQKSFSKNTIFENFGNFGAKDVGGDAAKAAQERRDAAQKEFRGSDMKRGGAVKKMASGGSVSSASSRGDGIAQRGKTRGKMC